MLSENVAFHKQSLQMMEKGVLMFQIEGSQLVVVWLESVISKRITIRKSDAEDCKIRLKAHRYLKTDIKQFLKQTTLANGAA